MVLLIIMMIAGGVVTWTAGIGFELFLGDEVATSLQFRFFVGIALSFAIGGSTHIKDRPSGISQNHGQWLAVLSIPGALFAAPRVSAFRGLGWTVLRLDPLGNSCRRLRAALRQDVRSASLLTS
ncbi:MAG: hypothetical protein CMJ24_09320 [Phycisphaerae bacterium]|nr:hypothetical protein [Phycisphaerae bacterium]MDG1898892.1 hypothetical protein [Phycisphaerales bacterium]